MKPYIPRANSKPAIAVEFLREHGRVPAVKLAEALGLEDPATISAHMVDAKRYGLVKSDRLDGFTSWSLGAGPLVEGEDDADGDPIRRIVHAAPASPSHFRCGLWTDGQLTMEKGAQRFTLSKDEVRDLATLLGVPA